MVVTVGAMDNTIDIALEMNEGDYYPAFAARLCLILMESKTWTPFKQYAVKNHHVLQVNDILLYFMPPGCGVFERHSIALLADLLLPCDLDYTLPRLQWFAFHPEVKIRDILSNRDGFHLLITRGKRIPWHRNSMEILNNRSLIKGFDDISIMRLNAIVADYLNVFTADKVHSLNFAAMVIPPAKFSHLNNYDLNDKEFILSIEKVARSIMEKWPVHYDD
jgi:hypothetical protein